MPNRSQKAPVQGGFKKAPARSKPELIGGGPSQVRRGVPIGRAKELLLEEGRTNLTLRRRVAYFLLSIFALNTVSTLAAVYLVGFGLMVLSKTVILTLIGETIAHAAAMFVTVTKFLFPTK